MLILIVLDQATLNNKKLTAYDIQKNIYKLTYSFWKPSPGSIYPILEQLLKKNIIEVEKHDNCYTLTKSGRMFLDQIRMMHLLSMVFMDSKLFDTFDPIYIDDSFASQIIKSQFTEVFTMWAEEEGIQIEKFREHINGIEKELQKTVLGDLKALYANVVDRNSMVISELLTYAIDFMKHGHAL